MSGDGRCCDGSATARILLLVREAVTPRPASEGLSLMSGDAIDIHMGLSQLWWEEDEDGHQGL